MISPTTMMRKTWMKIGKLMIYQRTILMMIWRTLTKTGKMTLNRSGRTLTKTGRMI